MKKILYVKWGGLGDHLQFTTLPELFHQKGCDFYISDRSEYRDFSHYELIWKKNPYVKGITSEEPNCGHIENWGLSKEINISFDPNLSIHRNIENIYGLNGISDYPVIYYKPNLISDYSDYIFLDINASSVANYPHNEEIILSYLNEMKGSKILYSTSGNSYGRSVIEKDLEKEFGFIPIKTKDIFNYSDIIYSSKKFVCLWSGGAHLATAIKKSYKMDLEIDCLKVDISPGSGWGKTDKSFFWYDCVNYIYC